VNCIADESSFKISIEGEPTYKLTNTIVRNGKTLGKSYEIDIIFTNSGNQKSDEIEVNLTDQEGYILTQRTIFYPGETKIITFNWSTMNMLDQKINVNYYPSDLDTPWNKYNSGKKMLTINVVDNSMPGTSTPGFEIILLITAFLFIIFSIKRKI
jgi:hypothetical protein